MSNTIETYLKVNKQYVPVSEYTGTLPDKDYVEGAIHCRINGRDLFTLDHWDLVDQLWCYILEALTLTRQGSEYDSSFPDQPLRLRFKPLSSYAVEITVGDSSHKFDTETVMNCLAPGAVSFFTAMKRLAPEADDTWERYLSQANALLTA
ncbi:MAG: hypothetical protein LC104_05625 [Bacteroidales bacterium]|nr:hypothetical protein [Bacteroidales bacterium]